MYNIISNNFENIISQLNQYNNIIKISNNGHNTFINYDLEYMKSNPNETCKMILYNYKGKILINLLVNKLIKIFKSNVKVYDKNISKCINVIYKFYKHYTDSIKNKFATIMLLVLMNKCHKFNKINDKIINNKIYHNNNVYTCAINNLFGESLNNIVRLLKSDITGYFENEVKTLLLKYSKPHMSNYLAIIALIYMRIYDYQHSICYLLMAITYNIQEISSFKIDKFINDYSDNTMYYMSLSDI